MADVGGEIVQRLLPRQLGNDAFAIVLDDERRNPVDSAAGKPDAPSPRVQGILNQLSDGLPGICLAARQPTDELEGIRGAKPDGRTHGFLWGAHSAWTYRGTPPRVNQRALFAAGSRSRQS